MDRPGELQQRVDALMAHMVSSIPGYSTSEAITEKVTSGTPLGAILPKHATRQIVDDNGKPVSHEELFGDVEKVEQQGSGQVGATTETKTLSWWGIRKHQQPQEAENRDPDTHRHQTKRSRHERKDAERRSISSPRRDKHSRKHR